MILTLRLALILIATLTAAPHASSLTDPLNKRRPAAHDEVAIADMRHFAQQHFVIIGERPETFRVVEQWSPAHVLRWMEFDTPHEIIRVYHATDKHNPAVRYISLWDRHHERYHAWQLVH